MVVLVNKQLGYFGIIIELLVRARPTYLTVNLYHASTKLIGDMITTLLLVPDPKDIVNS